MKYTNREDIELDSRKRYEAIAAIYGELKKKRKTVSNVELMVEINNIISEYVQVEQAAEGIVPSRQFDISQIDFDLLRREFAKAKKKNLVMKDLEDLIRVRLEAMLFNNPDRIKYHERYQQIIEEYNSQQDRATIEKTFDELMQLVKDMDQEEQRYVREGFSSDEELARQHDIPYQISARPHASGGNNASRIQLAQNGIRTVVLSIPCRYMHTPVEVCDLRDAEAAIQLIEAFCAHCQTPEASL